MNDPRPPRRTPVRGVTVEGTGRARSNTLGEIAELDKTVALLKQELLTSGITIGNELQTIREAVASKAPEADIGRLQESIRSNANAIAELKPKSYGIAAILGIVWSMAWPVGALVWAAGRYPDKADYNAVVEKIDVQRETINALRLDETRMQGVIDSLSLRLAAAQEAIGKLQESKTKTTKKDR